jgi:hypothetical protein
MKLLNHKDKRNTKNKPHDTRHSVPDNEAATGPTPVSNKTQEQPTIIDLELAVEEEYKAERRAAIASKAWFSTYKMKSERDVSPLLGASTSLELSS